MSPPPHLPDEIILRILYSTPPTDLLTLLQTSHQLKRCAEETIHTQILPKITLSTMQWHPSCLKKQDYLFSHISNPTPASTTPSQSQLEHSPLGPSLALSTAFFSVSMHYAYHSGTPWFIGWGVDYDGDFKVVDGMGNSFGQVSLPEDWQIPSGFLLKDVLENLPEPGTGPWPEALGGWKDEDEDSDAEMNSDPHSDSDSESDQ